MIRPLLSLERLSFDEKEGKVCYLLINHLKLSFVADRPSPPHIAYQELLMSAETSAVYEVDPLLCPRCGGTMKVLAFLTDFSVVDRIINHLKLTFVA